MDLLTQAGKALAATNRTLKDLYTARRVLFGQGYDVGCKLAELANSANVSQTFIKSELDGSPKKGHGTPTQQLAIYTALAKTAEDIHRFQEQEAAQRLTLDTHINDKIKAGETTKALAEASGLSTATIDRMKAKLKKAS
jgi:hypothetical protein